VTKPEGIFPKLKSIYFDDSGITGLETAIILIAFIVVAAVFAFTVMTTGLFSTEKAKTTAQAGIAEASSSFAPKGAIVAESNGMWAGPPRFVQWIYIQVTLATGATDASIDREDLAFIYTDDNQRHSIKASKLRSSETGIISRIIIRKIVGEVPFSLLREGEVAEIAIELNKTHEGVGHDCNGCTQLGANQEFRIEVIPPAGGSLIIARKTPPGIQKIMNLE
jgi:flagellin FlaB